MVVADAVTLKPIDKLYVEIKWDGQSVWSPKAEQVHGLSKQHLEEHGLSGEDAACEIASFVLDHFEPNKTVACAGHNYASFDRYFMEATLAPFDVMFKTGNRFIDTNSIGFASFQTYTSDQLFEMMGIKRDQHNALEDAMASLKVLYKTRQIYNTILGE